jgi:hypothetical protein
LPPNTTTAPLRPTDFSIYGHLFRAGCAHTNPEISSCSSRAGPALGRADSRLDQAGATINSSYFGSCVRHVGGQGSHGCVLRCVTLAALLAVIVHSYAKSHSAIFARRCKLQIYCIGHVAPAACQPWQCHSARLWCEESRRTRTCTIIIFFISNATLRVAFSLPQHSLHLTG